MIPAEILIRHLCTTSVTLFASWAAAYRLHMRRLQEKADES